MKKIAIAAALLLCFGARAHGQTVQCQTANGAWGPCPLNASVQLFSAVAATGTATASAQKVYNFSAVGELKVTWASITGSPSGCTLQMKTGDSLGNLINNGSAVSVTPANGTTSVQFAPAASQLNVDQVAAVYACTTYPTAGTLSLEFVPATLSVPVDASGNLEVNINAAAATVPVSGTFWQATQPVSGTFWQATQPVSIASLPSDSVTQGTTPWQVSGNGTANGATNGLYVNLLMANAALSATNAYFTQITDGTSAMGAMANYGTAPGAVKALNANVYVTNTVPVSGTFWQSTQPVSLASLPALPSGANTIGKVDILGNAGAAVDQAPGSTAPANAVQVGGTDGANTRVRYFDPCAFSAWTYYPINLSANTQVVAGSSGKNVYVCKLFLAPAAAAANVNVVESATSGNACATSPAGMMGGATAALGAELTANGGFVLPADTRAWMKTATSGDAMCIFASAQVTGVLAYVQF